MLVSLPLPEFNLKKQIYSSWAFHINDRSESSIAYDMIIGNVLSYFWRIRHLGILTTDNLPMKDKDTALYHQQRP
jgi:hypothetical protein